MQGTLLDNRYKILEQRSQDKLFTLYEALDQTEDRPVTVKILNQEAEQSSLEKLLRFRRDVQNVSKAIHPNLLKIFASGEFEGRDYVVTEHVNGAQPLSEYARQLADIDKAMNVILQVSSGLAAAHEHGIIHRAINPWSVLVFQNGDGVTAKLKDFGMGLLLDLAGIKEEDEVIRTFGYMSPEATGILRKPINER